MVCLSSILLVYCLVTRSLGLVLGQPTSLVPRQTTPGSGFHDGYYWYFWTAAGSGAAQYLNGPGGQYTMRWSNLPGEFIAGKGWKPGSNRNVTYNATYQTQGWGFLAIRGYTRNPLTEYIIVENWGSTRPIPTASFTQGLTAILGMHPIDGGYYEFWRQTYPASQWTIYWSIRTTKRTSGTVTISQHFRSWASYGMYIGAQHEEMLVAVEGAPGSSGTAIVSFT